MSYLRAARPIWRKAKPIWNECVCWLYSLGQTCVSVVWLYFGLAAARNVGVVFPEGFGQMATFALVAGVSGYSYFSFKQVQPKVLQGDGKWHT